MKNSMHDLYRICGSSYSTERRRMSRNEERWGSTPWRPWVHFPCQWLSSKVPAWKSWHLRLSRLDLESTAVVSWSWDGFGGRRDVRRVYGKGSEARLATDEFIFSSSLLFGFFHCFPVLLFLPNASASINDLRTIPLLPSGAWKTWLMM